MWCDQLYGGDKRTQSPSKKRIEVEGIWSWIHVESLHPLKSLPTTNTDRFLYYFIL